MCEDRRHIRLSKDVPCIERVKYIMFLAPADTNNPNIILLFAGTYDPVRCPNGTYTLNDTIELEAIDECLPCPAGSYCR